MCKELTLDIHMQAAPDLLECRIHDVSTSGTGALFTERHVQHLRPLCSNLTDGRMLVESMDLGHLGADRGFRGEAHRRVIHSVVPQTEFKQLPFWDKPFPLVEQPNCVASRLIS